MARFSLSRSAIRRGTIWSMGIHKNRSTQAHSLIYNRPMPNRTIPAKEEFEKLIKEIGPRLREKLKTLERVLLKRPKRPSNGRQLGAVPSEEHFNAVSSRHLIEGPAKVNENHYKTATDRRKRPQPLLAEASYLIQFIGAERGT